MTPHVQSRLSGFRYRVALKTTHWRHRSPETRDDSWIEGARTDDVQSCTSTLICYRNRAHDEGRMRDPAFTLTRGFTHSR